MLRRTWRATLAVAAGFWALCLVLAAVEARVGASTLASVVFFVSIPGLVGYLFFANREALARLPRHPLWVLAAGSAMLAVATLIVLAGLLAASRLVVLLAPA